MSGKRKQRAQRQHEQPRSGMPHKVGGDADHNPGLAEVMRMTADVFAATTERDVNEYLSDERSTGCIQRLIDNLHRSFDAFVESKRSELEIACRPGCAHCCQYEANATASEVFVIVSHVQKLSEADRQLIERRISEYTKAEPMPPTPVPDAYLLVERQCPLLDAAGRCMIYPFRPVHCRAWLSPDAAICAKAASPKCLDVPSLAVPKSARKGIHAGLVRSLRAAGFQETILPLVPAMKQVLDSPGAFFAWTAGAAIFNSPASRKGRTA